MTKEKLQQTLKLLLNPKAALLAIILCLGIYLLFNKHHNPDSSFLGYVEGDFVRIASPIGGFLIKLSVHRGSDVKSGMPLFDLEQVNETASREEASQNYEKAKFNLENIQTGKRPEEIEVIQDTLQQAEADLKYDDIFFERQKRLVKTKAVSVETLDKARANFEKSTAKVAELKAQLAVAHLPGREAQIKAAEKDRDAAKALLAQAQWRLDQKSIKSTVSGMVYDTIYFEGEWVPAGSPVVVLLPPENIHVLFFVPELGLGNLKIGQSVNLSLDGLKNDIPGKISFISPIAEYTPPVIFSREWREKFLFKIEAIPDHSLEKFHPGQPLSVTIDVP